MRFGFHEGFIDPRAREMAFGDTARFPFGWQYLEPTPGEFNWVGADSVYSLLRARGLDPIVTLTNDFGWRPGFHWQELVAQAAARYHDAAALEIWNEPNLHDLFTPEHYAAIFRDAHEAASGFQGPILVAGPSPRHGWEDYLKAVFKAGIPDDAELALHPYPKPGKSVEYQIDFARKVLRNRSGHGRLWVTEVGLSTNEISPGEQANGLVDIVRLCRRKRLKACVVFRLADPRVPVNNWEDGLGVCDKNFQPKPSYYDLREEVKQ